jgi:hypothetical protein
VDNCLTIGSDERIKERIEYLKKYGFGLKIEEDFKEYLTFHIKFDE